MLDPNNRFHLTQEEKEALEFAWKQVVDPYKQQILEMLAGTIREALQFQLINGMSVTNTQLELTPISLDDVIPAIQEAEAIVRGL